MKKFFSAIHIDPWLLLGLMVLMSVVVGTEMVAKRQQSRIDEKHTVGTEAG